MARPLLLVSLLALTVLYFVTGLALYITGVKRAYDRVTPAGRALARTAILPALAAAGSILLPKLLPDTTTMLGPFALGAVVLAPPLLALVRVIEASRSD